MFSALPPHAHTLTTYTPHISSPLSSSPLRNTPSPLSPRDGNGNPRGRDADVMMSSPTPASKRARPAQLQSQSREAWKQGSSLPSPPPSRGRERESVFSKRVTKANPLINRNADEGREARRKLFLKRVREGAEEKRWRDRKGGVVEGEDEVLRAIWVGEERRREEARRREAAVVGVGLGWEEEEAVYGYEEVMVDEVAREEQRELEALIGSLSQDEMNMEMESLRRDQMPEGKSQSQQTDTPYGSDDEEYDEIFMDVIEEENRMANQQQRPPPAYLDADYEMMDLS